MGQRDYRWSRSPSSSNGKAQAESTRTFYLGLATDLLLARLLYVSGPLGLLLSGLVAEVGDHLFRA